MSTSNGPGLVASNGDAYDSHYARRVMWILAAIITLVLYVEGMLTPSLPTIAREFHIGSSQASLILSSYIITGVALSPVVGKLGDIYGKKKMLSIVISIYAVCVSVTGFSPSFTFMVIARAFQGIGLTIFPLGMSLVREQFPRSLVPRAQGFLSAMFGAGFAISLPLGAWVSNNYGWRVTYHSAIPLVVALAVLVVLVLRESKYRRPEAKVDYVGASVLGLSLALIVLGLSEGPSWGWTAASTLLLFAIGAALLLPLAVFELRYRRSGGEPILDFRLLRQRNVMVTNIVGAVSGLGMYLALLSLTYLYQDPVAVGGYGKDILGTGLSIVPLAIGMLVFAPIAGILVSRIGTRPITAIGAAITGIGFALAIPSQSYDSLLGVEFIVGAGIGIVNSGMINLLVLTVDPKDMGLATSMSAVFRNIGSSIGAPLSGSLLATFTASYLGFTVYSRTGFEWSFAIAAVAFAFAGGFILLGREVLGRNARPESAVEPVGASVKSEPGVAIPRPE